MKTRTILNVFFAFLLSMGLMSCKDENTLSLNDYPSAIVNYVKLHFPDNTISRIKEEKENNKLKYEVILSGNIELDFNTDKQVTSIDAGNGKLPDSVVPLKIRTYITLNYPNQFATSWEIDKGNQEVETSNGTDLVFDMDGNFIRVDK